MRTCCSHNAESFFDDKLFPSDKKFPFISISFCRRLFSGLKIFFFSNRNNWVENIFLSLFKGKTLSETSCTNYFSILKATPDKGKLAGTFVMTFTLLLSLKSFWKAWKSGTSASLEHHHRYDDIINRCCQDILQDGNFSHLPWNRNSRFSEIFKASFLLLLLHLQPVFWCFWKRFEPPHEITNLPRVHVNSRYPAVQSHELKILC